MRWLSDLNTSAALSALTKLYKQADESPSNRIRNRPDHIRKAILNAGLGAAGYLAGESGSVVAGYGGVPLTRYLLTGYAFPRYKTRQDQTDQTTFWKDFIRQTVNTMIRAPASFFLRNLTRYLLLKALSQKNPTTETSDKLDEDDNDWNDLLLAATMTAPTLIPTTALSVLLEPASRYFEYGSFYPTYVVGDDNREIQHRVLDDVIYGLVQSLPAAAGETFAIDRALKAERHRIKGLSGMAELIGNLFSPFQVLAPQDREKP